MIDRKKIAEQLNRHNRRVDRDRYKRETKGNIMKYKKNTNTKIKQIRIQIHRHSRQIYSKMKIQVKKTDTKKYTHKDTREIKKEIQ